MRTKQVFGKLWATVPLSRPGLPKLLFGDAGPVMVTSLSRELRTMQSAHAVPAFKHSMGKAITLPLGQVLLRQLARLKNTAF